MKNHRNLSRLVLLAGFVLPLAVSWAGADQLVTFVRGQSIVAQSIEKRGTWYFLTLEGGGELGVPASVVAHIEAYEAPPAAPAAAPEAPPAAPVVPAAAPQAAPAPVPAQAGTPPAEMAPAAGSKGLPPNSDAALNPNGAPGDENWRFQGRIPAGSRIRPGLRAGGERQGPMGAGRLLGGVMPPGGAQSRRTPPSQDPPQ